VHRVCKSLTSCAKVATTFLAGLKSEISVAQTVRTASERLWEVSAVCFDGSTVEQRAELALSFDPTTSFHT
jgi:nicotinamidase-related amidase